MLLPGRAWLELRAVPDGSVSRYEQRAIFVPKGLAGYLYWNGIAPAHAFVFGGMVVCIALTRFPAHTGRLYATDLAGSAAGCILTIPILNNIHAPSAVILNAGIAASAAAATC